MSVAVAGPVRAVPAAEARGRSDAAMWGRVFIVLVTATWASSFVLDMRDVIRILTVLGFAAAIAGLANPVLGLMGVAILGALDAISRVFVFTGGLLRWNTLSYFLLAVAVLRWRDLARLRGRSSVWLVLLLGLLVLEIPVGTDVDNGIAHVLSLSAVLGLLVFARRAVADPEAWGWTAIVTGVLAAGGGFAFYRHGALGASINPNAWVYLPLTALVLGGVALVRNPGAPGIRRAIMALSVVNLGWAFLSGSRGGLLAAFVAMAFLVLGGRQPVGARAGALLALVGVVAVTSLFADLQGVMDERLAKLVDPTRSLANRTSGRSDLALAGWIVFRENPLGVGTGGFALAGEDVGQRENLTLYRGRGATQAHSAWIKTLAENGVPGIVLLAGFVGSFALTGFRRRREGLFGFGLLASAILSVSFLSTEFQAKGLWLFVAAAIVVLDQDAPRPARRAPRAAVPAAGEAFEPWNANDPESR